MANALLLDPSAFTTKNPHFLSPKSTPLLRSYPIQFSSFINLKPPKPVKLSLKCDAKTLNSSNSQPGFKEKTLNSIGFLLNSISDALKSLKKPAIAALLVGILLMYDPNSAFAASGGRVGGRCFDERSSMSSSRSYSSRSSDRGYSYSVSYSEPSSASIGFYAGPAIGAGSSLIMMGLIAFVVVAVFLAVPSGNGVLTETGNTSVIKLQVGLLGMARSLQSDLNRIAETADTSSPEGLNYVLTETMLALLRHPDYCISAYSSVDIKKSIEEGEKKFNQLSIEERGKFDEETLVNVNNMKRQSTRSTRNSGFKNEYIVVTILVAAEGVLKLPTINGSKDLKEALQKLGSIPSSKIMAVEVLWTPQNENDTLSERELLEDYSLLKPL